MTISDKPFIQIEVDFTGKDTVGERQEHLEDIAAILFQEYFYEALGSPVSFYAMASSRMKYLSITDFDLKEFDIKIKARKFLKQQS